MTPESTDVHVIFGRRGSGKTTLSRKLQTAYPRKIIFDPLHEYTKNEGDIVFTFNQFGEKILEYARDDAEKFTIIFQFDLESEDNIPIFDEALALLYSRGSVMVVVEEIHMVTTPHCLPKWFRNLIFLGRHRKLGAILTTQRPARCHKDIISQANHIWLGPLHEKNDLGYVATVLPDCERLLSLPARHFYHYQPGPMDLELVTNDLKKVSKLPTRELQLNFNPNQNSEKKT